MTGLRIDVARSGSTGMSALPVFILSMALLFGCVSAPPPERMPARLPQGDAKGVRASVVDTARSLLGSAYRYGGRSPETGFDCSGLVVYSYQRAGIRGLPQTASGLARRSTPVSLEALEPGDLLFFRLGGRGVSHVALYEGQRRFIHAPSSGKRVERVAFDHPYWGPRLERAGRLLP